jgi:hypothetical protein
MLALFAAVALFGWMSLPRGSPHRSIWLAASAILLIPLVLSVSRDMDRIASAKRWVTAQRHAQATLEDVISSGRAAKWVRSCPKPVHVPNHRVIPLLAFLLDEQPRSFVSVSSIPTRGLVIAPGSPAIAATLLLGPDEPRAPSGPPRGFELVTRTPEWSIYARC